MNQQNPAAGDATPAAFPPATDNAVARDQPPPSSRTALYKNWNSYAEDNQSAVWNSDAKSDDKSMQILDNGITRTPVKADQAKRKQGSLDGSDSESAKKRPRNDDNKAEKFAKGKDYYCWCCHKEKATVSCLHCPRSYHQKCLTASAMLASDVPVGKDDTYVCYYCKTERALDPNAQSLKGVPTEELNDLLLLALEPIRNVSGANSGAMCSSNSLLSVCRSDVSPTGASHCYRLR